ALARANLKRGEELAPGGGVSKEDLDQRRQTAKTAEATVEQALQMVYANRVALGLPPQPHDGKLADVPANLEQTYSSVRSALANRVEPEARMGLPRVTPNATPRQVLDEFIEHDKRGDIEHSLKELVRNAPPVRQAAARLEQARHDLDQAELNLSYCDIVSEI